jgi:hypothetical protein
LKRMSQSQQPPGHGPAKRKGLPCPYTDHSKFFAPLFFSQKRRRFVFPIFLIKMVDL